MMPCRTEDRPTGLGESYHAIEAEHATATAAEVHDLDVTGAGCSEVRNVGDLRSGRRGSGHLDVGNPFAIHPDCSPTIRRTTLQQQGNAAACGIDRNDGSLGRGRAKPAGESRCGSGHAPMGAILCARRCPIALVVQFGVTDSADSLTSHTALARYTIGSHPVVPVAVGRTRVLTDGAVAAEFDDAAAVTVHRQLMGTTGDAPEAET